MKSGRVAKGEEEEKKRREKKEEKNGTGTYIMSLKVKTIHCNVLNAK